MKSLLSYPVQALRQVLAPVIHRQDKAEDRKLWIPVRMRFVADIHRIHDHLARVGLGSGSGRASVERSHIGLRAISLMWLCECSCSSGCAVSVLSRSKYI